MRALISAAAVLLLTLTACADHDSGYPPQAFSDKATSTCVSASKAPQKRFPFTGFDPLHPQAAKLPAIAAFYDSTGWPLARMLQKQLHDIGEPDTGRTRWDAFLAKFDSYVATYRRQIDTARRSDTKGFTASAVAFRNMVDGVNAAADAANVPRCSPFHLGQD